MAVWMTLPPWEAVTQLGIGSPFMTVVYID